MRRTEVNIVVNDSSIVLGMIEESRHLRTNHRIHSIVGAKHHNVIRLDVGINEIQLVMRMILIEDVFRIVLLVEKC